MLDVMRFLAASAVVAFHLSFYAWANAFSTTGHAFQRASSLPGATPWTWFGWVGVEVFFVISGFVIAHSAVGVSAGKFLKNRALRLLPAAWICATITLLARHVMGLDSLGSLLGPYLSSLVLSPMGPWIDGVYWSLGVEIVFYTLIFALIKSDHLRSLPTMAGMLTLWSGAFLLLSISGVGPELPGWRLLAPVADFLLLRHGAMFATGVWLWLLSEQRIGPAGRAGLAAAMAVSCLEIWMRGQSLGVGEAPAAAGQPLLLPVLVWIAVIVAMIVVTRRPGRFEPKSTAARAMLWRIGLITYPLYLVHNVLGAILMRQLILLGAPMWLALAAAIAFVVGLAFLIAVLAEPALRRWLRRAIESCAGLAAKLLDPGRRQPAA
jgi:exopolysaccharide production protein ExoZ